MAKDFYNILLGVISGAGREYLHDQEKIEDFFFKNWSEYNIFGASEGRIYSKELVDNAYSHLWRNALLVLNTNSSVCTIKPECRTYFDSKVSRDFALSEKKELIDISDKFKKEFAVETIEKRTI